METMATKQVRRLHPILFATMLRISAAAYFLASEASSDWCELMNHAFCTSILGEPCPTVCQAIMSAAGVVSALCAALQTMVSMRRISTLTSPQWDEQGPFTQAPDEAGAHMVNPALSQCSWLLV